MPAWGNTDAHNAKPKWDLIRETREVVQLQVLTGNTAGNTVISVAYNDGGLNNVANIGVVAGQYVYFMANGFAAPGGTAGNGYPSMFFSNTTVSSTSGNTITLSNALFGTVSNTFGVEFDKAIAYNPNKTLEANAGADVILVTTTRSENGGVGSPNSAFTLGNVNVGWNRIQKKVNNDGTVRYLKETLVALASPTAANTNSGNTSWGQAFTGL
jgi:hypothetical protein